MAAARPGMVLSVGGHVAILAFAVFGLGQAVPRNAEEPVSLPVDILTPEEFTQLTRGDTNAKVLEPPRVQADKIEPEAPKPVRDAPVKPREVTPAAAPPPPPPPPAPTPPAEPKAAEAAPPPPPVEPQPAAEPEPEPQPAETAEVAPAPAVPTPAARPAVPRDFSSKPTPPAQQPQTQQAQQTPQREFRPDQIAALIDRRQPSRTERGGERLAETSAAGADRGNAERLAASELQLIASSLEKQVSACWSPPIGAPADESGALVVTVQFALGVDGRLTGAPSVVNSSSHPYFNAYSMSAVRAVQGCTPVDLPAKYHDLWKEVRVTFDPRKLLGLGG